MFCRFADPMTGYIEDAPVTVGAFSCFEGM